MACQIFELDGMPFSELVVTRELKTAQRLKQQMQPQLLLLQQQRHSAHSGKREGNEVQVTPHEASKQAPNWEGTVRF